MQATEPEGAYCGDQPTGDAYRLCGLVLEGLYGFAPGTMTIEKWVVSCSYEHSRRHTVALQRAAELR